MLKQCFRKVNVIFFLRALIYAPEKVLRAAKRFVALIYDLSESAFNFL